MANGDHEGRIFYPIFTNIMDSFSCSPLNAYFILEKHDKDFKKNPEYAEMLHGDIILTLK